MKKIYFNFKRGFLMKLFMVALAMILCLSNVKAQDVSLLGSWSSGTTKAKEIGTKRLLLVTVTGETAVMNNIANISLSYGGQVMTCS